jgi:hypothetical protein
MYARRLVATKHTLHVLMHGHCKETCAAHQIYVSVIVVNITDQHDALLGEDEDRSSKSTQLID